MAPKADEINQIILEEEKTFKGVLGKGLQIVDKVSQSARKENNVTHVTIDGNQQNLGEFGFYMYETYGLPASATIARLQKNRIISSAEQAEHVEKSIQEASEKHKEKSRSASAGRFAGGLADHSEETTRLHTATHLLHKALRDSLGEHVQQMGSNITKDRLRFDFSHPEKLTDEEIAQVEQVVNQKIQEDLAVIHKTMPKDEALAKGALAFFQEKYPDMVSVYCIGGDPADTQPYSMELCGGPHVTHTGELGTFKITKQENIGRGVRRLRAILE
jgi:alanyl-tRNA synthetase